MRNLVGFSRLFLLQNNSHLCNTTSSTSRASSTLPQQPQQPPKLTPKKKRRSTNSSSIDAFGTWDYNVASEIPLLVESSIARGSLVPDLTTRHVGVSSVRGRRPAQEDFCGMEQVGRTGEILYISIFDGHGGETCSRFCAKQMPKHIQNWLLTRPDMELTTVLHHCFLDVNNAFARYSSNRRDGMSSGSTATVCLLDRNSRLTIGHVGDSRVILCRSGEPRKLTTDHIPSLITEQSRVEKSGGRVSRTRVNDRLSMTRSIGDLELKPMGVIAVPEVRSWEVSHSRDAFVVLTSDGINSVMTDLEIVEIVKQAHDPLEAAHSLTDMAIQYSSEDNSTALVCPLGSWGKYSAKATIFHSFGKSFTTSSRFS